MKFARRVFLIAGIYGLAALLPGYFLEEQVGRDYPPPITHPEYYYGFIGVAVAWQVVFLIVSRDPIRYRPMMIPAILEKATFGIAVVILFAQHRVATLTLGLALIDATLGVLFVLAYIKTAAHKT